VAPRRRGRLGKTIEACLILSRLVRTDRADRVLVVAPSTLTVQWLGELWRKFHQVFVLLDAKRRADVAKDHGPISTRSTRTGVP
jgi:SNF2 family N-terminal domain.